MATKVRGSQLNTLKRRLLVVDDEPELRNLLKTYLSNEGYDVEAEKMVFLLDVDYAPRKTFQLSFSPHVAKNWIESLALKWVRMTI